MSGDLIKLKERLKKEITESRYEHSMGVAYTAANLAMKYGLNIEKALIAGLLHDCAKSMEPKKMIQLCEKNHVEVFEVERKNPGLLHAKAGAILAKEKYDIHDTEILDAITWHTTGKPNMTLLEMIVFVADYIEPHRYKAMNLTEIRKEAYEDINKATLHILKDTIKYLEAGKGEIDKMTYNTYQYYNNL